MEQNAASNSYYYESIRNTDVHIWHITAVNKDGTKTASNSYYEIRNKDVQIWHMTAAHKYDTYCKIQAVNIHLNMIYVYRFYHDIGGGHEILQ